MIYTAIITASSTTDPAVASTIRYTLAVNMPGQSQTVVTDAAPVNRPKDDREVWPAVVGTPVLVHEFTPPEGGKKWLWTVSEPDAVGTCEEGFA